MLKQLEVFLIAAVFVLVTAIVLIINTWQRADEFKTHNKNTQKAVVNGAVYAISKHLQNRHRHVQLFVDEYEQLIIHLNRFPSDEQTADDIRNRLKQRFADFFTFTVTDQKGTPVLEDIESLVGKACQLDLNNFSSSIKTNVKEVINQVVVHPQPFNYHYDIMAPIYMGGLSATDSRIFFASFYLNELADILKTHEVPGQSLMLVKQSDDNLIEVSREGAREKFSRNIRLTHEEQERILVNAIIPNTAWKIINLPDVKFENKYLHKLWREAIIIMCIVAFALFLLIVVLIKIVERRAVN
ncbi:MAG: hypothetical protein V3U78_03935 [Thiotrichaceae bacterium]